MVVSSVPVRLMALALLTKMSMPPNFLTASSTAACSWASSRMSTKHGRQEPPAASTGRKTTTYHKLSVLLEREGRKDRERGKEGQRERDIERERERER